MLKTLTSARRKSEEGFTLIELMIVVIIIGILAAIAIPIFQNQQKAANFAVLEHDVKNVATIATQFKGKHGRYPQTCVEWKEAFPEGFKSGTTSAIGAATSPDGLNIWVEAQAIGMGSGSNPNTQEVDSYTAVFDTGAGKGVLSRAEYMQYFNKTDRTRVFYDSGYTNPGVFITSLQNANCQVWGSVSP